ncbi:hypothetical protein G6F42_026256 [Rhizopus arrhizus]|nr:hypothetical protein G6F42_026256 [Rhizopus arrhizus]
MLSTVVVILGIANGIKVKDVLNDLKVNVLKRDTVGVKDTDVKLTNTASGILNGVKVHDVANDARVNVA